MVIARRKQCKDQYAEVRGVLTYLAEGDKSPNGNDVPLPIGPPPKSFAAMCQPKGGLKFALIRGLARALQKQALDETKELRSYGLSGGMHGGVWGELKALLVMTPRRSLMLGGMSALAQEADRRQRSAVTDEAAKSAMAVLGGISEVDEEKEEEEAMKNALDVLEEDGEIDLKKQDDRTITEAISETCARA